VTVLRQQIIVSEAIVHESVLLALGHRLPLLLVKVCKADVFDAFLLLLVACGFHPIVVWECPRIDNKPTSAVFSHFRSRSLTVSETLG
jgi:hypothetical protein